MSELSAQDIASYDHSALFFVTNWQVIDVGYVASRRSAAPRTKEHPRLASEKMKV
jgi:hypothetical protein